MSSSISPSAGRFRRLLFFSLISAFLFGCALQAQPTDPPPDPPGDVTPPDEDPPTDPGDPPADDPGDPPEIVFSEIINISTRGKLDSGPGEDFNVGFALRGTGTITIVCRAVGEGGLRPIFDTALGGPGASVGIIGLAQNPQITVTRVANADGSPDGTVIGTNDNYTEDPRLAELNGTSQDPTSGSLPIGTNDSSLVLDLSEGNYTIQVTEVDEGSGIVLGEATLLNDPLTDDSDMKFINVSTRGKVDSGAGEDFNIGFAFRGEVPLNIVHRGVGEGGLRPIFDTALGGPGASEGIIGLLADPQMTVTQVQDSLGQPVNNVIGTNDNYGDDPNLNFLTGTAFDPTSGSLPIGTSDASILLLDVSPGNYTIQITDVGDGSGISLGEASIYDD